MPCMMPFEPHSNNGRSKASPKTHLPGGGSVNARSTRPESCDSAAVQTSWREGGSLGNSTRAGYSPHDPRKRTATLAEKIGERPAAAHNASQELISILLRITIVKRVI